MRSLVLHYMHESPYHVRCVRLRAPNRDTNTQTVTAAAFDQGVTHLRAAGMHVVGVHHYLRSLTARSAPPSGTGGGTNLDRGRSSRLSSARWLL